MAGHRLVALALLALSSACAEPTNKLFGSIDELYSLEFDQVRIRKQQTDLIIDYLRDLERTVEKPVRIVVETAELAIEPKVTIADQLFTASVHLSRVMISGETFPPIQRGELELKVYEFKGGGQVKGEFFINFVNGRDLYGTFDRQVQEVVGE